jgi:hypothetical protein
MARALTKLQSDHFSLLPQARQNFCVLVGNTYLHPLKTALTFEPGDMQKFEQRPDSHALAA